MQAAKRRRIENRDGAEGNPGASIRRTRGAQPARTHAERVEAGRIFRNSLLLQWSLGLRSAESLCSDYWYHVVSGGCGTEDLALDPAKLGSNQSRFFRKKLGLGMVRYYLYQIFIPMHNPESGEREILPLWVHLPHERIHRHRERHVSLYERRSIDRDNYLAPSFCNHPLVQRHGVANVEPFGYYTDKVRLGQTESFYRGSCGITWIRKRLTLWLLRDSYICQCGCGGSCTLDALQIEMNKSINLLQDAVHMSERLDGRAWQPSDACRRNVHGAALNTRAAMTEYRGDLPERCARSGMKTHKGGCMRCSARPKDLHGKYHECSLTSHPWLPTTHERYMAGLKEQLHKVEIEDAASRDKLIDVLRWKQKHPWGRTLVGNTGRAWNLKAGDRLIIGGDISNPHELDSSMPVPFVVYFSGCLKLRPIAGVVSCGTFRRCTHTG